MIDALLVPTYRTLDTLTIIACTGVLDNRCVMFCNSTRVSPHTDVLVLCDHRRRDDGGLVSSSITNTK